MTNLVDRGTLEDPEYINGQEMLSNETSYYSFERPNGSVTQISTGSKPRNQDWTVALWFSETPGDKPLNRKFNLSPRSRIYVGVEDDKILILDADDNIILTIVEKMPGRKYYLNLQNRAGKLNYYYINSV